MALKMSKMWSNGIKTTFFSKKLQKIVQQLDSLGRLEAPPPDPRLWYIWITVHLFT